MIIVLYVVGGLSYLFGCLVFSSAKGAIHETLGMACFVNGTVAIASAVIAQKIESLTTLVMGESEKLINVAARQSAHHHEESPDRDRERRDPDF